MKTRLQNRNILVNNYMFICTKIPYYTKSFSINEKKPTLTTNEMYCEVVKKYTRIIFDFVCPDVCIYINIVVKS